MPEDIVPAEDEKESASVQPEEGDQETAQDDGWATIQKEWKPEQITEAIKAYQDFQRIEEAGGLAKIVQDHAAEMAREQSVELAKSQLQKLRESPQGRAILAKWAGLAQAEDEMPEDEKRYRALESQLYELKQKLDEREKDTYSTKEEVTTLATQQRLSNELREIYSEHPEYREFHDLMWPSMVEAIRLNPRECGGPGWLKLATKHWMDSAQAVGKRLSSKAAKPRISQGGQMSRPTKNPEDMTEEEARAFAHSLLEG